MAAAGRPPSRPRRANFGRAPPSRQREWAGRARPARGAVPGLGGPLERRQSQSGPQTSQTRRPPVPASLRGRGRQ